MQRVLPETPFNDPADYSTASCPAAYPDDSPEEIFRQWLADTALPSCLEQFSDAVTKYCAEVFNSFWKDWCNISGESTHSNGSEGAIALLQTMSQSRDNETSLKAHCYLFVINRTPLSETEIGKMHGVTRATVCERVKIIRNELGLPAARGMKSDRARRVYAERAKKIHDNRKKQIKTLWKKQPSNLLNQVFQSA